jgi:hypothetical protein
MVLASPRCRIRAAEDAMSAQFTLRAEGAYAKQYAPVRALRGLDVRLHRAALALRAEAKCGHIHEGIRASLIEAATMLDQARADANEARKQYRA